MTLEDDLSVWGKIVGFILGGATLVGTLFRVGRKWTSLEWRVKNLEGQMEEMKISLLRMQEQATENTREVMEATHKVALHAAEFEGNVTRMVDAVAAIKDKVDKLEQLQ